ncbi:MAG: CPn0927/CPn0928 family alpha/beta hydrolase fold protein [Chlamydiota bacterium]
MPFYREKSYETDLVQELSKKTASQRIYAPEMQPMRQPNPSLLAVHNCLGKCVFFPASKPRRLGMSSTQVESGRKALFFSPSLSKEEWKIRRGGLVVGGKCIDFLVMGKPDTLFEGRWTLCSLGNAQFYELECLFNKPLLELLATVKSNALFFNYPGVGESEGNPSRESIIQAYRSFLRLLEQSKQEIGVKEILLYGHSIGAAVQAEALQSWPFDPDIAYLAIKSRTFSCLSQMAKKRTNRWGSRLISLLEWELETALRSKYLQVPEIILQTASVPSYREICNQKEIVDDTVISQKASLAYALLQNQAWEAQKSLIGIPEKHNAPLSDVAYLACEIARYLGSA